MINDADSAEESSSAGASSVSGNEQMFGRDYKRFAYESNMSSAGIFSRESPTHPSVFPLDFHVHGAYARVRIFFLPARVWFFVDPRFRKTEATI